MVQGNYKFIAECESEDPSESPYKNETSLTLKTKLQSVFIQTDKAKYKPGGKVKFRVLVLDVDLKPATIVKMNVFITVS